MPLNFKSRVIQGMIGFSILLVSSLFHSCGVNDKDAEISIDYIPIQLEKDGAWSFMSKNGNVILKDVFKNEPSYVVDGIFSVKNEKGIALYRIEGGTFKLLNGLDNLTFAGSPNCGLIPICKSEERLSVINLQGDTQFELSPVDGKEITSCSYQFEEDMLPVVNEDEKFGFFDKNGKCVIALKYDMAAPFSEGLALVEKDSIWSAIDKTGNKLFSLKKGQVPACGLQFKFNKLCARDRDGHQYYVYNEKGEMKKLPGDIYAIDDYNDEYIIYHTGDEGRWGLWSANKTKGLMTFDGDVIISPSYEELSFGEKDKILISREGRDWELSNFTHTKSLNDIIYTDIKYLTGFGYIGKDYKYAGANYDDLFVLNSECYHFNRESPFVAYGDKWWSGDAKSCYLPKDRIVRTLVDLITPNGLKGCDFGSEITDSMKAKKKSKNFENTPWIPIDIINIGSSQILGNIWENGNKVDHFTLWLNTPYNWGKKGVHELTDGFKSAGFKEIQHGDRPEAILYILEKDNTQIAIEWSIASKKSIDINIQKGLTQAEVNQWLNEFTFVEYEEDAEPEK